MKLHFNNFFIPLFFSKRVIKLKYVQISTPNADISNMKPARIHHLARKAYMSCLHIWLAMCSMRTKINDTTIN